MIYGIEGLFKVDEQNTDAEAIINCFFPSDGRCDTEIKRRTGVAKESFKDLTNILMNRKVKLDTRKRILNSYVWSTLLYGCETWTISKNMEKKLKSLELWAFKRMLKVSSLDRQSNDIVLDRFGSQRSLINVLTKRQMSLLGSFI